MKYKFDYKISALDLWKLSMYGTYSSMVGLTNIVFTSAMLVLTFKFWGNANVLIRTLLIFGVSLFTIIQPIAIYSRAKRQAASFPKDMTIGFGDRGIYVKDSNQDLNIKWNEIKQISKKASMIIIFTTTKHGFVITNKILGDEKQNFYNYLTSKYKKQA